jgi:hypothetical protein
MLEMFSLRWCGCVIYFSIIFFNLSIVYGLRKYERKDLRSLRYVYPGYRKCVNVLYNVSTRILMYNPSRLINFYLPRSARIYTFVFNINISAISHTHCLSRLILYRLIIIVHKRYKWTNRTLAYVGNVRTIFHAPLNFCGTPPTCTDMFLGTDICPWF